MDNLPEMWITYLILWITAANSLKFYTIPITEVFIMNEYDESNFTNMLMKLTERQQETVLKVLENLEQKNSLVWHQGWSLQNISECYGLPMNAISKTTYSGINSVWLAFQGYQDPRWLTQQQMEKAGYVFRDDLDEDPIKKGVKIEFSIFIDKKTNKRYDSNAPHVLRLPPAERAQYVKENVIHPFKSYTVFNAALLSNIKPFTVSKAIKIQRDETLEQLLSASQAPISYDGFIRAYYSPTDDSIHLPPRSSFKSSADFYGVALHEIGHSTGHSSRLNRNFGQDKYSEEYAIEELRAEFASIVIGAKYGLTLTEKHVTNHAAYIASWRDRIRKEPICLITALKDACKIAQYVDRYVQNPTSGIQTAAI